MLTICFCDCCIMKLLNEEDLKKIRNGDLKPLSKVHNVVYNDCVEFLMKKFNSSHDDAHDIVMDSYMVLVKKIQQNLFENNNVKSFLFKVGQNIWLNRKNRDSRIESIDPFEIKDIMKKSQPKNDSESFRELLNLVRSAIMAMSPKCKEILTLTLIRGLSLDAATDELKYKNKEACKSSKSRCLKKLIDILKK